MRPGLLPMTAIADSFAAPPLAADGRGGADRPRPLGHTIVTDAAWDETVAAFDGVCQEQLATFARRRWPEAGREPMVFERDGEVVGGSLMLIQRLPLGLGALAVAKWGP